MADHLNNKRQREDSKGYHDQIMDGNLQNKEENGQHQAMENTKKQRENNKDDRYQTMTSNLQQMEEIGQQQAMENTKRHGEENPTNLVSWASPDIVTSAKDLGSDAQPHEQQQKGIMVRDYSSFNSFDLLHEREFGSNDKTLPNIFREYHVAAFTNGLGNIKEVVITHSTVCYIHITRNGTCIVPFSLNLDYGNDGQPLVNQRLHIDNDNDGQPIMSQLPWKSSFYLYNPHNQSLIMVSEPPQRIISIQIECIKKGATIHEQLFQAESVMSNWEFDMPNCRGMIYNLSEGVFKVFELKKYSHLFAIAQPDSNLTSDPSRIPEFTFGSPGNTEIVIYQKVKRKSIVFRIYSKSDGIFRKEFFLEEGCAEFVVLCGYDRMVVQLGVMGQLEVMDISGQIPLCIRKTNIRTTLQPYYLHKVSKFICWDCCSRTVNVCNLEGEILVRLEDHRIFLQSFSRGSHITKSQDIIISVCKRARDSYSINVSSMVTGQCLAKLSKNASNCSEIRKEVLGSQNKGFAYDERTHNIFTANNQGVCCVWSSRFYIDAGFHIDFGFGNGNNQYADSIDSPESQSSDSEEDDVTSMSTFQL